MNIMKYHTLTIAADCSDKHGWKIPANLIREVDAKEFNPFYYDTMNYLVHLFDSEDRIEEILPYFSHEALVDEIQKDCYSCILLGYSHRIAALAVWGAMMRTYRAVMSRTKIN